MSFLKKIIQYNEPYISNALLIIASGFIECITFLLCFKIFASFMTGTIIIGVVEFAIHHGVSGITILRFCAILAAFLGGMIALFYIRYMQYNKMGNSIIFTKMLQIQSFIMSILLVVVFIFMILHVNHSFIAGMTVLFLSLNMGFHHHHLGIRYKGMIYRTHFMTFNTWNMFNLIIKYRELPSEKRKTVEGRELMKKYRFLFGVLMLFFSSVYVAALLINIFSFYLLMIPTVLFIGAAFFSRGKEV